MPSWSVPLKSSLKPNSSEPVLTKSSVGVFWCLILETFKVQLSIIIPNIEIVLDNLYQSINDIKLFALDLIN